MDLRIFLRRILICLLLTACSRTPREAKSKPVPAESLSVELSPVFGSKIIDLELTLDDDAERSLRNTPTVDVPARMSFKDSHGARQAYVVDLHIKGRLGSKSPLDRKPAFRVRLRNADRFYGLENLTLNNMVQDPTMLHEALGYVVYEAAGAHVPTTGYVRLTINGQPYGLYLNLETVDSQFLARHFGDNSGNLYEGSYGDDLRSSDIGKLELHQGTDIQHSKLKDLIRALEMPGDSVFYGPTPQVDTKSFIAMMAAGALLGDWDNYYKSNNYRVYWSTSKNRWFFIPTGIDQTFSASTTVFGATGLLFQKCLASNRCAREYAAKVLDVAATFERLDLPRKMNLLEPVMDAAAKADTRKPYDEMKMKKSRDEMRSFIATRPAEVRAALSCMNGRSENIVAECAGSLVRNPASNLCMSGPATNAKDGTAVNFSKCTGAARQRWRLIAKGDAFQFLNYASGTCLSAEEGSGSGTPRLELRSCADSKSQRFSMQPLSGTDSVHVVAIPDKECIAVPLTFRTEAALVLKACSKTDSQAWQTRQSLYD